MKTRQGMRIAVRTLAFAAGLWLAAGAASTARAEAILQVFNQSHNEIAARLPEIAEAGYTALWVPPPTKANGGMSVGYDLNDPFDIGNTDLRGTWSTRYGVEADLHNLIEMCHRFGMRVYFDNVMNHRSYDVPGYNESTPIDVYPGMCAEDFHLRTTSDGFYRKWDNVRSWDDEWQVMFLGLSDLLDIAHETPNQNFGANEGDWHEKPRFVRHPNNPEFYDWDPDGKVIGFGPENGLTVDDIAANPDRYSEDVGGYLCRAVRWLVDRTRVDGLRLDAVKHVPYYFFGAQNDDGSFDGYVGNVQLQFNRTRGFADRNNRESVFNSDNPRNDAMLFGEHLGAPPPQGPYVAAGMRLVDDRLRNELNWRFSANDLWGFDYDGAGSDLGSACGVMHAQSHDNDYVDRKPLHHAFYFMHKGLGLVYSDGNNHAATLTGSGGAFPRWAQTDFLGQWGQKQIPTLLHAHENFARYDQIPMETYENGNFISWQRGGGDSWATMLFMLNSSWDWWQPTHVSGSFPRDAWLYDYASDMYMPYFVNEGPAADYAWGGDLQDGNVNLPNNAYAIWSWKNPDPSGLFPSPYPDCFVNTDDRVIAPDSRVITILEDGKVVDPVLVVRKDGADGDPNFNPYNVADTNAEDYAYTIALPRVTGGTNVTLAVKADGSAERLLLRLDGGMDFGNHDPDNVGGHGWGHYWEQQSWDTEDATDRPDWRDYPPGSAHDFFLGFEEGADYFTRRIWSEKFAAADSDYCKIGTQGATTYEIKPGETNVYQPTDKYEGPSVEAPGFVWHSPTADTESVPKSKAAASKAAKAAPKAGAVPRAMATWVGATYIFANDWYKGDGQGHDEWYPAAFQGANLGKVSGSIAFGGQCQTYGEEDGEGNPARACYNIYSGSDLVKNGYATLLWYDYKDNNNWFESRDRIGQEGVFQTVDIDVSGLADGQYTLSVWFEADGADGTKYDNNGGANYNATFTIGEGGGGGGGDDRDYGVQPQFSRNGTSATIWAKTSHEQGARAFVYYTVDGSHWPEGGGGVPANPYTKAVEGGWQCDTESGSWWRFDLPEGSVSSGATLRYKVSSFREMGYGGNGWGTVWPGSADAIRDKKVMMSLWTVPSLDFTTQQYHKHLDYTSWTTGFKDGFHLVTARMLLNRTDGAEIANTFRQTFYLDLHTPEGKFMYPSETHPTFGETEYGMVFKTDNTVDEVWVHVTDSDDSNDTVGNGATTNGVEWARATQISPWTKEDAQDTHLTKLWRWTYSRIPSGGTATIRVRLREVSSAPVEDWSKTDPAQDDLEALHVAELLKVADTRGPAELFYFDWPDQDGTMVEAGWDVRVKYSTSMISGLPVDDVAGKFRVYVNATSNGSTNKGAEVAASDLNIRHGGSGWWDGDPATMVFTMPNVYNGIDGWRYALTVEFENTVGGKKYSKSATRMITHKGPLLPTCIITTPPETDSDGVKYVITMEDSTAARTNRALRETPIVVLTDAEATKLDLQFVSPTDYGAAISATWASRPTNDCLRTVSIESNGTSKTWTFAWQATNAGTYRVQATVTADNSAGKYSVATNGALRTATVRFRQIVHTASTNEMDDWDDDAIINKREQANLGMPTGESEYWTQEKIFDYWSTGKSDPDCPDSDGDGLPDGLELGYRVATDVTNPSTDTNGDGWPNFIWDRDPPFYNSCESLYGKVPGVTSSTEGGDRLALVKGSTTDPRNPDSDGDGIPDGVEDGNRNGWTDGDGAILPGDWDPYWDRAWPDGKMSGETWEETSPCIWDSDADGLSDGYGEDTDLDGWTDMGLVYENATNVVVPLGPADLAAIGALVDNNSTANSASTLAEKPLTSRAINYDALFAAYNITEEGKSGTKQTNGWPRLVILETDPLCTDTDHDGLPDGWENNYSLDPLNNGVYDFRTGQFTDDPTHGPVGNPDNDTYLQGSLKVPYDNAAEYLGGTNPRSSDNREGGVSGGAITVGSGDPIGSVNGNTFYTEATQWTLDDLVALDDYNQGGNSSDIYRFGDGFDSSRDMVAFYFRDGGPEDGNIYFRVDFDDLRAFAEDNALNIYVAINFGNYGNGLDDLPDDVNCKTAMKWNAVSGVYDSQNGCLYVQDGTSYKPTGGFRGAWFNSELDTVVWAIDRQVLVDAGWKLQNPDLLMFQIYTTRDFTNDDGGSGDKGGLNDFADVVGYGGWDKNDDWLCSDYWNDYNNIAQNGVYRYCVSRGNDDSHAWNNRGQHAKLAMVSHGNQAVESGNVIQALVNNGAGAGYDRPVQIHNIYTNCPLNLHITPTLAIALQWAEVGTENAWYSGPALNAAIKKGVANGAISLLGSTFSDHIPQYFPDDFNKANVDLAANVLNEIYGGGSNVVSRTILWSPERVADADWLYRMGGLGYKATLLDQTPHLLEWFGRQTALGNDAYKIQRFWCKTPSGNREAKAFALSTAASGFRYANTDGGLASDLRRLFLRRARTGEPAISSIFYMWEDFASTENADAYDRNLRWIANHPWIQVASLDTAFVDPTLSSSNNLAFNDLSSTNGMASQDWVHHACNGSYDNWFHGSWRHESLSGKQFEIRQGHPMEAVWGTRTNGVLRDAWAAVSGIRNSQVKALAEATIFASAFETAFHDEYNSDLSRWSYGKYISEANGWYWDEDAKEWKWKEMGLMSMSWRAQSRTRLAAMYAAVDEWTRSSAGVEALSADLDLDGEPEWILRNNTVMAVFEAEGGLMVGAWYKKGTNVWQMVGNFAAQPETGYETQSASASSTRGTAMKDITVGGTSTVADIFGVTAGTGKLTFKSGTLTKTVSLADATTSAFDIAYDAAGKEMYVRNGLSPDLATLMIAGQSRMTETADGTTSLTVGTSYGGTSVNATLSVGTGTTINTAATDRPEGAAWNTVNLRNAPQVRQVEVSGTGTLAYQIAFSTSTVSLEPPTITVNPEGDQIFPVGATTSFRVTARDWQGTPLPVEAVHLPVGPLLAGSPSWDATSGLFSWTMGPISDGSSSSTWIATAARTNDWTTQAIFTTRDAAGETATLTVNIIVPWDADGNGMGDDWEYYFRFYGKKARPTDFKGGDIDDDDGDGFSNQSEWVAGTDPTSGDDYIGWNMQSFSTTNITYGFRSVPGGTYHIVATDIESLPTVPATNWPRVATVTATTSNTLWSTNRTPATPDLIYGIRIPFRER